MNNSDKSIDVIVIVGPTATGKTKLSIELSKLFNGEVVSSDSMQIYKGMDIATAKPDEIEKQGVVHHMMDFLDPDKGFSVAQYCSMAHKIIEDINNRGKIAVIVGGTGLYIDSLINNITFSECDENEELRASLYKEYEEKGVDYLLDMLSEFDRESYKRLSLQKNVKRIIRAIEIYKTTGVTQTEHNLNSRVNKSPYNAIKIGLKASDRSFLYDRINKRVDIMVQKGLLDEARWFLNNYIGKTASMAIGYKELIPYFNNTDTLDNCLEKLKMQSRRYAKRQLTWFLRDDSIHWFDIDEMSQDDILQSSVELIKKELLYER